MEIGRSSLTLSGGDLARCQAVLSVLLSAASCPTDREWADSVLVALAELFGSDRSFLLLPVTPGHGSGPRLLSPNLEPGCVAALQGFAQAGESGGGGHADAAHARVMARLASAGFRSSIPSGSSG
jgi:hypothetical protein